MRHFTSLFAASLALFLLVADPALAQSIDLSPIQSLLQGIVDALTGPLGVVIATLAVLGVFLSWFFNIISPFCKFVFCAACARSAGIASGARNFVPPHSRKNGHSCRPQQGSAVKFTHCGQNV
ncbi:TrbC/VirB2 family protein [Flavimaricola marinus]|uniref:TrbC/VirB2 family protein n=1 Tax=Flavimaricola marinus TaxID=1819565 RepID=UPI001FEB0BE9|nr:TrbC/VirB2 family protein [Flavimaricola marinus]